MPIAIVPGHKEVIAKFGPVTAQDFREIRVLSVETYYEEDRETFEKSLAVVLGGPKGAVEYRFWNVTDFKLTTLSFLKSFDVEDIQERQLERKSFYFSDYDAQDIFGYAEKAQVSVCDNAYI